MQIAAARLATSTRVPAPEAIRALADLCIAEANGDEAVFETLPQGLFGATTGTEAFKLRKLDKVVGVKPFGKTHASISGQLTYRSFSG